LFKAEMAEAFLGWFENVEGGYEHCETLYGC